MFPPPSSSCPDLKALLSLFGVSGQIREEIPGDGSLRRFFRLETDIGPLVAIVPAPGGLFEARCWWLWAKFLYRKGLPVPRPYFFWPEEGVIFTEDLGNWHLEKAYQLNNRVDLLEEAVDILLHLQSLDPHKAPRVFLETTTYGRQLMVFKESAAFVAIFCHQGLKIEVPLSVARDLYSLARVAEASFDQNPVLLHRDFQSRNLMVKDNRLRLIDFQGLRLGPPAYDLASLLRDPYLDLSPSLEEDLLQAYLRLSGRPEAALRRQYDLLALHRHLQALSAFVRLTRAGRRHFAAYISPGLKKLKDLVLRDTFTPFSSLKSFILDLPVDASSLTT
ncbi:phosphotransferase [Thermosulfuriphilus ammonigenes]|uniref:Phosphotransferase n=1 Tax=Thermosulfuriphilus ammonigenes TaxID=1936021 RepID=A0A6G7PWS6_9BACT|nr:phosphotransferase [Thermosulfuriphilus ammonigenes]MBA2847725.1 hypothetical protein [Thermosulfuriphilus ammonigenes]QIJ72070.1 phosphotransferase [Thermosulfuriphilus ammonigenes]